MLSISKKIIYLVLGLLQLPLFIVPFALALSSEAAVIGLHIYTNAAKTHKEIAVIEPYYSEDVLAETTSNLVGNVSFNIPVVFNEHVNLKKTLEVAGESTFSGNIRVVDKNVDAGEGSVFASNLLYGVLPGAGISITAGQTPTISSTGVVSIGGKTGNVQLEAGSGIAIEGAKISSTVSTSITAGDGISVSGSTVTNNDKGTAQKIFKTIAVSGKSDIVAGTNTDTLTVEAGTGISLSTDATSKTLTINASGTSAGWTDDGSTIRLITSTDNVGIGTSAPAAKLHVVADGSYAGVFTGGNVGIGTTAPSAALDIVGDSQISGGLSVGFAGAGQDDRIYIGDTQFYLDCILFTV